MSASDTIITIFGIVAVVVILFVLLMVTGVIKINTSSNQTLSIVGSSNVDLRLVAQPYLVNTNSQSTCNSNGGTWYYDKRLVGCVATRNPIIICTGALVQAEKVQCIGAGGDWVCDANNIYCRV